MINVNSSSVEVEISKEIPSSAPIIDGRVHKIGQIGTLVKIPLGVITLYAIVTSVSNYPNKQEASMLVEPELGSRFLQVQLLGEKIGNSEFVKGVGTYPTINDAVHIVTENDFKLIYGERKDGFVEFGKHSSSENLPVYLDLKHLVLRHSAILGSTGSGKSNATANIIKSIMNDYKSSRIILIDPHGEYASAFQSNSKVFRIDDDENPLYVPFWTMTFDELAFFLVGREPGEERPETKQLREKIVKLKKLNADNLEAGTVDQECITADSPIPFDIKKMWYDFDREVNATYSHNSNHNESTEELENEGDYRNLIPAKFKPYTSDNSAPYKSKKQTMYPYLNKIYSRLCDGRFNFMFNPGEFGDIESKKDMNDLLKNWVSHNQKLTILDLSGIPFELIDIAVGLITRIIFDSMFWGRNEQYTGRNRPILMVYEEAHSYLSKGGTSSHIYGYALRAVEKVFKEGRKFGVGAMVVSQRPSEISETILSQVGTFISLRLTNSVDKGRIQSASPNNMSSLIDLLSSLRVGEAIVVGEAIKIPTRVTIQLVSPRPASNDPDIVSCWKREISLEENDYKSIVTNWRHQKRRNGEVS